MGLQYGENFTILTLTVFLLEITQWKDKQHNATDGNQNWN